MHLFQSGSSLSGNYSWDDGKLEGSLSGSNFKGKWTEAPSYSEPRDAGDVEFIFSEDCASFSGKWRYGSNGTWSEDWSGTKLQEEEEFDRIEEIFEEEELKPLCDVEGEGELLGHIVSHTGDVKVIRNGEDITDEFAFVETVYSSGDRLKMLPILQGDTIITGDYQSNVKILYYNHDIRSGWDRTMKLYSYDKYGNPMTPFEYEVPHTAEDFLTYYGSLSEKDQQRYMSALYNNQELYMGLGLDTHFCPGDYLEKDDKRKGIAYWIEKGIVWWFGKGGLHRTHSNTRIYRSPLPGTTTNGIIGFRGTEIIVKVESQIDSASIFVNEGAITFTSASSGETWDVSEGESSSIMKDKLIFNR
jgi:hypothetical protein